MIKFSVTKNGVPLSKDLYSWNEETRTFSSNEDGLVLDFTDINDCTFNTGSYCTFNTDYNCTFNTGSNCTFKTGCNCTFKTGNNCCLIRYDVKGVTEIPENKTIKLNDYQVAGYTIIEEKKEISCDGKIIEIDGKKYKLIEQ